ncbi:DUF2182 domain-containing protein [Microvirga tunisiensis]|uniref:DUF2182 domain-containing protein n=1 Tax=Pannonibacter tanglangensis TaxID=2750084 RepID=A0A7X5J8G1_9HYPH|nr:DUF2182 domain-containing protein [Pannonibacter sp. XCT-53]NBN77847.1 DUF2182 domain-containing protein [Pannonibacter sp. XCT-53]
MTQHSVPDRSGLARLTPGRPRVSWRDRAPVIGLVGLLALAGWAYLGTMIAAMVPVMDMTEAGPGMGLLNAFNIFAGLPAEARAALAVLCLPGQVATFGMPAGVNLAQDAALVFLMWMMMTLAMMLPSAMPVFLAHAARGGLSSRAAAAVHAAEASGGRQPGLRDGVLRRTALIAAGYLLVWTAYAVLATAAQLALMAAGLISPMMAPVSLVFAGTTLVAAGIYQFTPAKAACLSRCWVPRWQSTGPDGSARALVGEGLVQGLACFGCCWAMMTVMFAVGIMNIVWVALLGILMTIEKTIPSLWLYKAIGVLFLAWGGLLLGLATGGAG